MRLTRWIVLLLCMALMLRTVSTIHTQSAPLVVFIEEADLQTAAVTDNGPDGLTRLADIFRQQGAQTTFIRLDTPIPQEAQVVVLARPRRALTPYYLSRLWLYLERGGNLLLALDPVGQGGNPDAQNTGLDRLLSLEYGIGLFNGLLVEPWSTSETILNASSSNLYVYPEDNQHPVIAPLYAYNLPVMLWGARNLRSEFYAPNSSAQALLFTEPAFAETNAQVYRAQDPAPLELNIGTDAQGRLGTAALAENFLSQSRVAVLGDGEIFQNGFGLAPIPGSTIPRHPGNYLLALRLASWLLELPVETWPPLPDALTWVAVDGSAADWENRGSITTDALRETSLLSQEIQQVRGFRNRDYVYLLVETALPPDLSAQLSIQIDSNVDGQIDRQITLNAKQAIVEQDGSQMVIPDVSLAIDQSIELRLPQRVTGAGGTIIQVCLSASAEVSLTSQPDCLDSIAVPLVDQRDATGLQIPDAPLATVSIRAGAVANLRAGPGTSFDILTSYPNDEIGAAIGRNEIGDWIKIQTPRHEGWINAELVELNTDPMLLAVVNDE